MSTSTSKLGTGARVFPETGAGLSLIASPFMADLNVALIGINYAPEPTGIAPYTTGMAEHLAGLTRSTTVITGVPHYPNWTVEPRYRRVLRTTEHDPLSGLTVHRLRHHVPGRQTAITRAAYEATFLGNAMAVRLDRAPDLVVAVTPSLGGAVAGARLARRYAAKLLVVVQDLMAKAAAQSGMSGGGRVANTTARMEQWALSRADEVAVVSEAFRPQLHEYGIDDERISLLPNWTHIESVNMTTEVARATLGWREGGFVVLHTGNIGLKQDLGNLVEAARRCADQPDVRFVIVGDGSQRDAVRERAAGLRNLEFIDPVSSSQYPTVLAAADVLVVNERASVGDMSLPSKLTSYLAANRPILAAVGEEGATSRELARTHGAVGADPARRPGALRQGRAPDLRRPAGPAADGGAGPRIRRDQPEPDGRHGPAGEQHRALSRPLSRIEPLSRPGAREPNRATEPNRTREPTGSLSTSDSGSGSTTGR
jgi:colanic acid biosynthesis glycosyl transferase WcaI